HLECLNQYASQLPPNTAPAGYACPICSTPIFSFTSGSSKSPIVSSLEAALSSYPWAREGIGLGLLDTSSQFDDSDKFDGHTGTTTNGTSLTSQLNDSTRINMPVTLSNAYQSKLVHNNLNNNNKANHFASTPAPISVNNITSFISTNSDLSF